MLNRPSKSRGTVVPILVEPGAPCFWGRSLFRLQGGEPTSRATFGVSFCRRIFFVLFFTGASELNPMTSCTSANETFKDVLLHYLRRLITLLRPVFRFFVPREK